MILKFQFVHIIDGIAIIPQPSSPAKETKARKVTQNRQTRCLRTYTAVEGEKRQRWRRKASVWRGFMSRGLSVGDGPGPSVVHSSVIFTTPQAPKCLPAAAVCTHSHARTHTHARIADGSRRIQSVCNYPSAVIGQLTSACSFVSSHPALFFFSFCVFIHLTFPPVPAVQCPT